MAFGPAAGLELVDALSGEPALAGYHLLSSVRDDLLGKLGRAGPGSPGRSSGGPRHSPGTPGDTGRLGRPLAPAAGTRL